MFWKNKEIKKLNEIINLQRGNLISMGFELKETRSRAQEAEKELARIQSLVADWKGLDITDVETPAIDQVQAFLEHQNDLGRSIVDEKEKLHTALENAVSQLNDNEQAYNALRQQYISAGTAEKKAKDRLEISRKLRLDLLNENTTLKTKVADLEAIKKEHEALLKDRKAAADIIDNLTGLIDKYTKRIEDYERKQNAPGDCKKCAKLHREIFITCKSDPDIYICPKDVQKKGGKR